MNIKEKNAVAVVLLTAPALALVATLAAPLAAAAADEYGREGVDTPEKVITIINKFGGWLYGALLALAVVFIIYAAFLFLTSGGDAEKVGKAKKQLIYAVVAVATTILATGVIKLVQILLA